MRAAGWGVAGGGGALRRSPPPCPVGCRPAILCLRRAPLGYTRAVGVGVARSPVGRQWVSAAGGGEGGGE